LTLLCRVFGPSGVEYLQHVEQRLFPVNAPVLQAVEVSSTVAEPVDTRAIRMELRAGTGSATVKVFNTRSC
jgi:hypothetical protein